VVSSSFDFLMLDGMEPSDGRLGLCM